MVKVLGVSGSPRKGGNSDFLLEHAKRGALDAGNEVEWSEYSIRGKKYAGCLNCSKCAELKGECCIKDDFQAFRDIWVEADVVIYSIPVYHMTIPGQLRCFMDRLGNSQYCYHNMQSPKTMKVIGGIAQGIHIFSGQEHALTDLINHALVLGNIYVNGDVWESYIGAGGWTNNVLDKNALRTQYEEGDFAAQAAVKASYSVGRRCTETAMLLLAGGAQRQDVVNQPIFAPFAQRIQERIKA